MSLNLDHFNEWITALRSGDYEQGQECLFTVYYDDIVERETVRHCCLGVGCEIAHVPMDLEQALPTSDFIKWLGLEPSLSSTSQGKSLDEPDTDWNIGIFTGEPGDMFESENTVNVASLNDGSGGHEQHSFRQIADWLEEHRDQLVAL